MKRESLSCHERSFIASELMPTPFLTINSYSKTQFSGCVLVLTGISSPPTPEQMDWSSLYPDYVVEDESMEQDEPSAEATDESLQPVRPKRISKDVEVADIGCGFGGLTIALAPMMPDTLILGRFS